MGVELGRRYEDGEGLEQNYTLAVERLRNQWKEQHALSLEVAAAIDVLVKAKFDKPANQ